MTDAHLYAVPEGKTTWKCLKSGQEINASAINDDYCDCDDGTDEPGEVFAQKNSKEEFSLIYLLT